MVKVNNYYKFLYLTCFLLLAVFATHSIAWVSYFGKSMAMLYSFAVILYFSNLVVANSKIYKPIVWPIFFIFIVSFFYILSSYDLKYLEGLIYRLTQLLSISAIIHVFYFFGSGNFGGLCIKKYRQLFFYFIFLVIFVALMGWYVQDSLGFLNPNVVGMWMGVATLIVASGYKNKLYKNVFLICGFSFVLMSGSRTSVGAMIGALILYYLWPIIIRSRLIFHGVLAIIFTLAVFIISLTLGDYLSDLNEQSRNVSGKNLESGRQYIWPIVVSLISERPWLGWGGGVQLSDLSNITLSAHNFYLQVLLQVGFFGLFGVLLFLFAIWDVFWKLSFENHIRWSASIFIYILLCQNFEVTLLQNNMALSWPMWCYASLSIGIASKNIKGTLINPHFPGNSR